jgi:hypothetical protein
MLFGNLNHGECVDHDKLAHIVHLVLGKDSGFGILGFGIRYSGFRIQDSGFGIRDSGFGILGFEIQDFGLEPAFAMANVRRLRT